MRFEYSPEQDGREMVKAEAMQQIALQLESISDEIEQTADTGEADQ